LTRRLDASDTARRPCGQEIAGRFVPGGWRERLKAEMTAPAIKNISPNKKIAGASNQIQFDPPSCVAYWRKTSSFSPVSFQFFGP
jgi:hypothetical protein